MPQQRMLELNCLARGISDIERSSGWVWGVTVKEPAPVAVNSPEDFVQFIHDVESTRFQFNLRPESDSEFYKLPRDENSACEFLLHHGVFRERDLDDQRGFPKQIREYWSKTERKGNKPFALRLADLWDEQAEFRDFLMIVRSLSMKNIQEADKLASKVLSKIILGQENPKGLVDLGLFRTDLGVFSKAALRGPFSDQLAKAAVRLDFREGVILPSIFTLYALPGLYAQVWKRFLDRKPLALCARCGTPFAFTRPGKIHCSAGCKNAAKQRRYRDRQEKLRLQSTKRMHGGKK
jgi:hypothetical protein